MGGSRASAEASYGACTLAGAGEREAARGLLQRRALGESRWVDPYYVGVAQLGPGDGQAGLDGLKRSYAERSPTRSTCAAIRCWLPFVGSAGSQGVDRRQVEERATEIGTVRELAKVPRLGLRQQLGCARPFAHLERQEALEAGQGGGMIAREQRGVAGRRRRRRRNDLPHTPWVRGGDAQPALGAEGPAGAGLGNPTRPCLVA
jgi:hypothetical protein